MGVFETLKDISFPMLQSEMTVKFEAQGCAALKLESSYSCKVRRL